jgi:hypothetical protein
MGPKAWSAAGAMTVIRGALDQLAEIRTQSDRVLVTRQEAAIFVDANFRRGFHRPLAWLV